MSERLKEEIIAEINDAWLNIKVNKEDLIRPLDIISPSEPELAYLRMAWLCSQPDYFPFFCKNVLKVDLLPFQGVILKELWQRKFPMLVASRGLGKTFILALYALLRAIFLPGRKIVVVGAAFRQSKYIHAYIESIWRNSPLLRDICDQTSGPRNGTDECRTLIGPSVITCLPIGNGDKIRGQRSNDTLCDEFAAMNREIFETVIVPFGAVSSAPADNVRRYAAKEAARKLGYSEEFISKNFEEESISNQIVISGTADYDFKHFATYWKKWVSIIKSKGQARKLEELFGETGIPDGFDWRDYCVIRMPIEKAPKGFMDEAQVARSKATVNSGVFLTEYCCVFAKDSKGFFKRSLIESCIGDYDPRLIGDPNKRYIIAGDPASAVDNFAITVLEIDDQGQRRVVYCWTTNKKDHIEKLQAGFVAENNFYTYCAFKIRELMSLFPTIRICIDSQGGGFAISEALHDKNLLKPSDLPIWPIINPDKPQPSDNESGLHILELCSFANYSWYSEAHHGLKKDLEDRVLIFPKFDPVTIAISLEEDKMKNRTYDTFEDNIMEIEEMKNEATTIECSQTPSGRERWDTPEIKTGVGKKGRLKKDRFSALLMANMGARQILTAPSRESSVSYYGGFADRNIKPSSPAEYIGPAWFVEWARGIY